RRWRTCDDYVRALFCCVRGCGCGEHPAFPAPSDFPRDIGLAKLGRLAAREGGITSERDCEKLSHDPPTLAMRIMAGLEPVEAPLPPPPGHDGLEAKQCQSAGRRYLLAIVAFPMPRKRSMVPPGFAAGEVGLSINIKGLTGEKAFGGRRDAVYFHTGRGSGTDVLRRDADRACPRRRSLRAASLAAAST